MANNIPTPQSVHQTLASIGAITPKMSQSTVASILTGAFHALRSMKGTDGKTPFTRVPVSARRALVQQWAPYMGVTANQGYLGHDPNKAAAMGLSMAPRGHSPPLERMAGGLGGAVAAGLPAAEAGAALGAPLGPVGSLAGATLLGGLGMFGGGRLGEAAVTGNSRPLTRPVTAWDALNFLPELKYAGDAAHVLGGAVGTLAEHAKRPVGEVLGRIISGPAEAAAESSAKAVPWQDFAKQVADRAQQADQVAAERAARDTAPAAQSLEDRLAAFKARKRMMEPVLAKERARQAIADLVDRIPPRPDPAAARAALERATQATRWTQAMDDAQRAAEQSRTKGTAMRHIEKLLSGDVQMPHELPPSEGSIPLGPSPLDRDQRLISRLLHGEIHAKPENPIPVRGEGSIPLGPSSAEQAARAKQWMQEMANADRAARLGHVEPPEVIHLSSPQGEQADIKSRIGQAIRELASNPATRGQHLSAYLRDLLARGVQPGVLRDIASSPQFEEPTKSLIAAYLRELEARGATAADIANMVRVPISLPAEGGSIQP